MKLNSNNISDYIRYYVELAKKEGFKIEYISKLGGSSGLSYNSRLIEIKCIFTEEEIYKQFVKVFSDSDKKLDFPTIATYYLEP